MERSGALLERALQLLRQAVHLVHAARLWWQIRCNQTLFCFCLMNAGLYAAFDAVNTGVASAVQLASSNLVGIGLTPEVKSNIFVFLFLSLAGD